MITKFKIKDGVELVIKKIKIIRNDLICTQKESSILITCCRSL